MKHNIEKTVLSPDRLADVPDVPPLDEPVLRPGEQIHPGLAQPVEGEDGLLVAELKVSLPHRLCAHSTIKPANLQRTRNMKIKNL